MFRTRTVAMASSYGVTTTTSFVIGNTNGQTSTRALPSISRCRLEGSAVRAHSLIHPIISLHLVFELQLKPSPGQL